MKTSLAPELKATHALMDAATAKISPAVDYGDAKPRGTAEAAQTRLDAAGGGVLVKKMKKRVAAEDGGVTSGLSAASAASPSAAAPPSLHVAAVAAAAKPAPPSLPVALPAAALEKPGPKHAPAFPLPLSALSADHFVPMDPAEYGGGAGGKYIAVMSAFSGVRPTYEVGTFLVADTESDPPRPAASTLTTVRRITPSTTKTGAAQTRAFDKLDMRLRLARDDAGAISGFGAVDDWVVKVVHGARGKISPDGAASAFALAQKLGKGIPDVVDNFYLHSTQSICSSVLAKERAPDGTPDEERDLVVTLKIEGWASRMIPGSETKRKAKAKVSNGGGGGNNNSGKAGGGSGDDDAGEYIDRCLYLAPAWNTRTNTLDLPPEACVFKQFLRFSDTGKMLGSPRKPYMVNGAVQRDSNGAIMWVGYTPGDVPPSSSVFPVIRPPKIHLGEKAKAILTAAQVTFIPGLPGGGALASRCDDAPDDEIEAYFEDVLKTAVPPVPKPSAGFDVSSKLNDEWAHWKEMSQTDLSPMPKAAADAAAPKPKKAKLAPAPPPPPPPQPPAAPAAPAEFADAEETDSEDA